MFQGLPKLLWAIIDTPEFQRLRGLKQTGVSCLVFPGARHSRFEHSIGVANLGMSWARDLRGMQPELAITDRVDLISQQFIWSCLMCLIVCLLSFLGYTLCWCCRIMS